MKAALVFTLVLAASTPAFPASADEPAPKSSMRETLRARIAEDARKAAALPAGKKPVPPTPPATEAAGPVADAVDDKKPDPRAPEPKAPATLMPKVEVRKGKYSERDRKLALELHRQDRDIARERKNLKASETDLALNDSKIARPLAIFGGNSAQFRQRVAAERVELMEAEKDIIEQIAIAQKPGEKKELQKQLDELRAMRRQLDRSLR